ncbi:MAG: CBS domain-containing protein [Zoogloeaceae bacterium]|jgi:magnesium and cobalt transporter|nr:CBS domain-containing protein [Zoogloeaceae bacterium]
MDPDDDAQPNLFERLSALLLREPEDRRELLKLLRGAHEKNLMDADALAIIEGALSASETRVGDVLVPRAQMDVIDVNLSLEHIIATVVKTGHSRFPVVDGDRDNVLGILLAKDLLRVPLEADFNLRGTLRPAVFIPESKRLNVLLREFRVSHNHMAIVVNEYSGVIGLITIENVLEQIVGDIADEYDFDETLDNILLNADGSHRVKAQTKIETFNAAFGTRFSDEEFDTVGGLILRHLGRVPQRDEVVEIEGLAFRVLRADSRRIHTLVVQPGRLSLSGQSGDEQFATPNEEPSS